MTEYICPNCSMVYDPMDCLNEPVFPTEPIGDKTILIGDDSYCTDCFNRFLQRLGLKPMEHLDRY